MRKVTYEDIFFICIHQDNSSLFTDDIKNYIFLRLKYIFENLYTYFYLYFTFIFI